MAQHVLGRSANLPSAPPPSRLLQLVTYEGSHRALLATWPMVLRQVFPDRRVHGCHRVVWRWEVEVRNWFHFSRLDIRCALFVQPSCDSETCYFLRRPRLREPLGPDFSVDGRPSESKPATPKAAVSRLKRLIDQLLWLCPDAARVPAAAR